MMENFLMWKVREIADKVTNVVMNYTEIEAKVREATNDEAWGPTGQIMQELAHSTFTYEHFPEVMSMLWKRMLQDNKQHWRRTYKSLLVLNYLIRNGSERVVTSAREHIYDLRTLENYTFTDEHDKDQGVNIRHKVKELIDFIQDDDKLREERKKAKKNKDKYIGMSWDMMGGSRSGGSDRWMDDNYYNRSNSDYGNNEADVGGNNRYRDRSFEEDYDVEKEESDSESNHNNARRYKDTEQVGSPKHADRRVNLNLNSSITKSPAKAVKTIKKVDLGAAANFGKDDMVAAIGNNETSADLLNDDFNPRAMDGGGVTKEEKFGDFESAFGAGSSLEETPVKSDDDFADFSSAFTSPTTPQSHQPNLFETVVAPTPVAVPSQPNNDLLLGDLGFDSLNINNTTTNNLMTQTNGNQNDLLDDFSTESGEDVLALLSRPVVTVEDSQFLGSKFVEALEHLPGPLTLARIKKKSRRSAFLDQCYGSIVQSFVTNFRCHEDAATYDLFRRFCFIENRHYAVEALTVLLDTLSQKMDGIDIRENLITGVVVNEGLFDALIYYLSDDLNQLEFEHFLQMIISLPSRLANAFSGNVNDFFIPKNYSKFLLYTIFKVVEFGVHLSLDLNGERLGQFVSKFLLVYCCNCESDLNNFVLLLYVWRDQRYRSLTIGMLNNLSAKAVEILAPKLLKHTPPNDLLNVMDKSLLDNKNWKHILTVKLPLLSYFECSKSYALPSNLVMFLHKSQPDLLFELILNLLDAWSNKLAIEKTSVEQHFYITKLIIVSVAAMIPDFEKSAEKRKRIKDKVLLGMPNHLQCAVEEIRCMGMVTGETVLNFLQEKSLESIKLLFDYKKETERVLKAELSKSFYPDILRSGDEKDFNGVSSEIHSDQDFIVMFESFADHKFVPLKRDNYMPVVIERRVVEKSVTSQTTINSLRLNETNEDLDSDDDLVPYDTSNDVTVNKKQPPVYLSEIRDGLLEATDPDVFTMSLENCEKVIKAHMTKSNYRLGIELMDVLISLTPKFYVDNFDELVLNACVALVLADPNRYAQYLGQEFHSFAKGIYSISHRILILMILQTAVLELAKGEVCNSDDVALKKLPLDERLKSKTRYFMKARRKVETKLLFEDCMHSFFYPLINGYKSKMDALLLINYLHTLSVIGVAGKNCTKGKDFATEAMRIVMMDWEHEDAKVRLAVTELLFVIVGNYFRHVEYMRDLIENLLNERFRKEPNTECRILAKQIFQCYERSRSELFTFKLNEM
ncbi:PREDICTED: uncharacterized protein LOC108563057 [Nicrophorus vespilloides]|uniref:Uncharacterized protein LOC108563057 n=1 Tax=Nicrophorus vespilloides TaxID=110193 RepID=A0ABM1MRA5_NICVS|nr:PREDICTED: uncharacterized protein LOC108563057 [Nicrophorus vespilloides]